MRTLLSMGRSPQYKRVEFPPFIPPPLPVSYKQIMQTQKEEKPPR
jgi:hypothetical protein